MNEDAIIEGLDLILTSQEHILMTLARLSEILNGSNLAREARDDAEAHALWIQQWRRKLAMPPQSD